MVKVEVTRPLEAWTVELASCHFHHILFIKATHKTSPETRGEEEFQELQPYLTYHMDF